MSICEASSEEEPDEGGCPSTPQGLAVSPDSSTPPDSASLNVSWTTPPEGSDAEFYYLTLMREQGQQGDVLPQRYNVSLPDLACTELDDERQLCSFDVSGLDPCTLYSLTLSSATADCQSLPTAPVTQTTLCAPPPYPPGLAPHPPPPPPCDTEWNATNPDPNATPTPTGTPGVTPTPTHPPAPTGTPGVTPTHGGTPTPTPTGGARASPPPPPLSSPGW